MIPRAVPISNKRKKGDNPMNKLLSALLVLFLLLPCAALAQAPTVTTLAFGDFSMDLDPNTPGEVGVKADNEILLQVYPAYLTTGDDVTTLSVTWTTDPMNLDSMDNLSISLYGADVLEGFREGFEASGLTLAEMNLDSIEISTVGGKKALVFDISAVVDYSSMGPAYKGLTMSIYQRSYIVPVSDGAYAFVGVSQDADTLEAYIAPIMDTVRWL